MTAVVTTPLESEALRARRRIRAKAHTGPTAGLAPGYVQGNLVVLPAALAPAFTGYCEANPKPCPLLAVAAPGDPALPRLGTELDVRTDLPRYRLFRHGAFVEERLDILDLWRSDFVAFVLGCSFSFEEALMAEGLIVRHVALGRNVPMYRTSIETTPSGPFGGPMVVSMRPFRRADVERSAAITARFPKVHGAPVHVGDPSAIGIGDLQHPDFGDAVPVGEDEVPVFWACGVTPQVAIERARPEVCISHAPGCMLITDVLNATLAVEAGSVGRAGG